MLVKSSILVVTPLLKSKLPPQRVSSVLLSPLAHLLVFTKLLNSVMETSPNTWERVTCQILWEIQTYLYILLGVTKAVNNVNTIIGPALVESNIPVTEQKQIDEFLIQLDGTPNKGKLGANAILGVSLAVAKAAAGDKGVPLYVHFADLAGSKKPFVLPVPAFNVINGGSHAGNKLAMQEFMILPTGAKSFREAMKIGSEVYHNLQSVIKAKYGLDATNVGDEGGFAPNIQKNEEGLELLVQAIEKAGYTGKVKIGMDVAASEFYKEGKYDLDFKNPNSDKSEWIDGKELTALYNSFAQKYPSKYWYKM